MTAAVERMLRDAPEPTTRREARAPKRKRKAPFTVLGAISDLLLLAGGIALLFAAWKFYLQPAIEGASQQAEAVTVSAALAQAQPAEPAEVEGGVPWRPPPAAAGEQFGVLYVPGLGAGWMRPITISVEGDYLADNIGHYPTTQAAGQIGNFALAGHRTGWGDPFIDLPNLDAGDMIWVETVDGWYGYQFRNGEYIQPTDAQLLEQVPMEPVLPPSGDRVISLQTCNPPHQGGPELYIAYGTLAEFVPRSDGPPAEVAAIQSAAEQGGLL